MGGWRGWIWPGTPTRAGDQCRAVLPGTSWQVWGRWRKPFSCRTPSRGIWKVGRVEGRSVDTPSWRWELGMIPNVDDIQELAQKIWASFKLPWQMSEIHGIENYYLAPLAPNCLHWKDYLLLPDPRFPCQDLWEEQLEKTVANTQALQCWAERANLSMPGQPCLLVRSVLKLCEMMEWYISFSNNIILGGVALPEGFFGSQTELTIYRDALPTFTIISSKEITMEEAAHIGGPLKESTTPQVLHEKWAKMEAPQNWFPGWEKVLHPSRPVTTVGQTSLAFSELKQRHHLQSSEARRAQCQRAEEHLQAEQAEWDSTSPGSPEPIQMMAPSPGFKQVTVCLQGDPLSVTTFEVPLESIQPEAVVKPAVAMMCASHVVQDEASRVTYMEMVTTSVGCVALGCTCPDSPKPPAHHKGPYQCP